MDSFNHARQSRMQQPTRVFSIQSVGNLNSNPQLENLPDLNLNHLLRLSDNTGILQHATYQLPNYAEGYTTDDNARALILVTLLSKLGGSYYVDADTLATRYMAFLYYAYNPKTGRFRNFLDFNRTWLEEIGSEDSQGRALWSLGTVLSNSDDAGIKSAAARLLGRVLPTTLELNSPRSWAFSLLGICEYLRCFSGDRAVVHAGRNLAERLFTLYCAHKGKDWFWFEDSVTYNNATLSHALLLASLWLHRTDMAEAALESLLWLAELQTNEKGDFAPIGNDGFYRRGSTKPRFDQQPIEAGAMVSACLAAHHITNKRSWLYEAQRAFNWFMGQNDLGLALYNPDTGGCYDGLHPDRVNQNQGAESTLSFLMALLEMRYIKHLSMSKVDAEHDLPASLQGKHIFTR
jgi:hypothetical protein